jgi:hypothetical protein
MNGLDLLPKQVKVVRLFCARIFEYKFSVVSSLLVMVEPSTVALQKRIRFVLNRGMDRIVTSQ